MNEIQFNGALLQDLDSFIECYQFIDDKQIYTNGSELIPVFRIKQWFEYNNQQQEIDRLNHIIDELEKWTNMQIDFLKDLDDIPNAKNIINEHTTMVLTYQNILDKLKELKEEGK